MIDIPIDPNLSVWLTLLRVSLLFSIIFALVTVLVFEFINPLYQRRAMLVGFFLSAFLAGFWERFI